MKPWHYVAGELHIEQVPVADLAIRYGTPLYVYSAHAITARWRELDQALSGQPHLICYAVKANSNLSVLRLLTDLGSGFDVVSMGELDRVIAAGGRPDRTVFSGVGKSTAELRYALKTGVHCIDVESIAELTRLGEIAAQLGQAAPVALRVNPDVDAATHPYISTGLRDNKFGIPLAQAEPLLRELQSDPRFALKGIACHIGSQITDLQPLRDALTSLLDLADRLGAQGIGLEQIDIGGGIGIRYREETPPSLTDYGRMLSDQFAGRPETLVLEPGRALVGEAGVLLTRVEYLKTQSARRFAIVDAAMNDLLRPALYQAHHDILPARARTGEADLWDIVGPVCESGDFLGLARRLALQPGDLLAVSDVGAYGFVMASNYNSRPRPAEVLVSGAQHRLVRRRESLEALYAAEIDPEEGDRR